MWTGLAYHGEVPFCKAHGPSETTAMDSLRSMVKEAIANQAPHWLRQSARPEEDVVNCPEGAVRLPIDLWTCKITKDICPLQAQVPLQDQAHFFQHCQAPEPRKTQIFATVERGAYEGFHHMPGRYLCPACQHSGRSINSQYHYPWELTLLGAYFPFNYEQDWPTVRRRLKDKNARITLVSNALCAEHCKHLAEQIDPSLAAELRVIELNVDRGGEVR